MNSNKTQDKKAALKKVQKNFWTFYMQWMFLRLRRAKWRYFVISTHFKNCARTLRTWECTDFLSGAGSCCEYQWMDQNAINYGASQCSDCWQSIFSIITLNCHLRLHVGFYMKVIYIFLIGNLFVWLPFLFFTCACLECAMSMWLTTGAYHTIYIYLYKYIFFFEMKGFCCGGCTPH